MGAGDKLGYSVSKKERVLLCSIQVSYNWNGIVPLESSK